MIKLVIFDLDGTVADSPESMCYTCNRCLEAYGLTPQPVARFKYFAGDGARTMVERALAEAGDPQLTLIEPVYEMYKKLFAQGCTYHVKSYEGVPEMLAALKAQGLMIAVCSNKAHENAVRVVETIYGKGFFDAVAGHCSRYPKKPDPASALLLARQLGVSPQECLYVGDTNTDMMTGTNAAMYTIGVTWGFRDREELEASGADAVIDKPDELLAYALREPDKSNDM